MNEFVWYIPIDLYKGWNDLVFAKELSWHLFKELKKQKASY